MRGSERSLEIDRIDTGKVRETVNLVARPVVRLALRCRLLREQLSFNGDPITQNGSARLLTRCFYLLLLVHVVWCLQVSGDEPAELAASVLRIRAEFDRLDVDGNQRLTLDEFVLLHPNREELTRDFGIYDFDQDRVLTRSEFEAVSGLSEAWIRGSIPDPFDDLLEGAVAALDESYDQWNMRPNEYVNSHTFVANFIGSISPEGKKFVTGRILRQADANGDGRMNRSDARKFLKYQLGVLWDQGHEIREPTGRVLRLDRFLLADVNNDGVVTNEEFVSSGWGNRSNGEFDRLDVQKDGRLTFSEFRAFRVEENYFDPVEWFRDADLNLNGFLDLNELTKATNSERQHLLSSTLEAFDRNRDQQLTLREFRLSMLANYNYPWAKRPADVNRDGVLSYDEFVFHSTDLFQLQRRYYFHRLDRNGDQRLSTSEFAFVEAKPNAIRLNSLDGVTRRLVYQDADFPVLGLPDPSPEGNRLLFHRTSKDPAVGSRIVLADLAGDVVSELCSGRQPSWSPDGSQFVCARSVGEGVQGKQIWVMTADGRGGRSIGKGTAPRWSPDGKSIAFLRDNGILLYDTVGGGTKPLLVREGHRYTTLGDGIAWSPAGDRLALLATRPNFVELILVSIPSQKPALPDEEPQLGAANGVGKGEADPSVSAQRGFASCRSAGQLSWGSDGIYFSILSRAAGTARKGSKIQHWVPAMDGGKMVASGLSTEVTWKSACMGRKGKWYIGVSEN